MKTCRRCLKEKALDQFYVAVAMKDGHINTCRDCSSARSAEYRLNNLARIQKRDRINNRSDARKAQDKLRRIKYREDGTLKRKQQAYNAKYPFKIKAHRVVKNAIRRGRLVRLPCEVCGAAKAQAHHDDYSKPLDIRWLCRAHHMEHHRKYQDEG